MITAEYKRKFTSFQNCFDFGGQLFASVADLAKVLKLVVRFRERLRTFEMHVTEVVNCISESRNALRDTRHAQRCWSNIDSGHARAVAKRHAENAHGFLGYRSHKNLRQDFQEDQNEIGRAH